MNRTEAKGYEQSRDHRTVCECYCGNMQERLLERVSLHWREGWCSSPCSHCCTGHFSSLGNGRKMQCDTNKVAVEIWILTDEKLCDLMEEYGQILVVNSDNVGSNQLQNIRKGLRGDSVVLMGKNTMMKRSVRMHAEKTGNNAYLNLIPLLVVSFTSFLNLF